jgi:hypothetical protein
MRERNLIITLLAIGIVCFLTITTSRIIISDITSDFVSGIAIPHFLCLSSEEGHYYLETETSLDFCERITDIQKGFDPRFCDEYEGEKKEACLGLVDVIEKRSGDCLGLIFGKNETSVTHEEIQGYCDVIIG